jgi:hypothetical protein
MEEERPLEKSYPSGVRRHTPAEMAPLPVLFDPFIEECGLRPAFEPEEWQKQTTRTAAE